MASIDSIVKKLPPETQELIRTVWGRSPGDRLDITTLVRQLPSDTNLMRVLLKMASTELKLAFGGKRRVAIVGPANVGKSTLYNQLVQQKEERAVVSPVPGTTRTPQQGDAGLFAIIDTPGADAIGEVGQHERDLALNSAAEADFLVIVFDAIQGIKQTELNLYQQLVGLNKPYIVVLNKIDLVRRQKDAVISQVAGALGLETEQVIPVVARSGENMNQVVLGIAMAEPALVTAMGQAMPHFRWQLAWRTISSSASVAAAIALTPLPVIDFAPLVVTQSVMVLGISRIYDYKITLERARELVITFGLGLLGRTLFAELSKFAGLPGWLLSSAIASATTVVMGIAAAAWFDRGERMSRDTLNRLTRQLTQYMLESLKNLGKRKPNKQSLRQQVEQALRESDLGKTAGPDLEKE